MIKRVGNVVIVALLLMQNKMIYDWHLAESNTSSPILNYISQPYWVVNAVNHWYVHWSYPKQYSWNWYKSITCQSIKRTEEWAIKAKDITLLWSSADHCAVNWLSKMTVAYISKEIHIAFRFGDAINFGGKGYFRSLTAIGKWKVIGYGPIRG